MTDDDDVYYRGRRWVLYYYMATERQARVARRFFFLLMMKTGFLPWNGGKYVLKIRHKFTEVRNYDFTSDVFLSQYRPRSQFLCFIGVY